MTNPTSQPNRPPQMLVVEVPNVGRFVFRRRTIGDEIRIGALYEERLGGVAAPTPSLDLLVSAFATLRVLCADHPPGWEPHLLEQVDALAEPNRTSLMIQVYGALSAREDEFRPEAHKRVQKAGPGDGADRRVPVPEKVQPSADGSPLSGDDAGGD